MQSQLTIPFFADDRLPARFWAKVTILPNGCWEWTGARYPTRYGAFRVGSLTDGSRRKVRAHRLSYEMLVGLIAEGLEIDHLCRNRACVNPLHLEPVTHAVNSQRSPIMGPGNHTRVGEAHPRAKLTEGDIPIIRALRGRISQRSLAKRFGVSQAQIGRIQRGEFWRHTH